MSLPRYEVLQTWGTKPFLLKGHRLLSPDLSMFPLQSKAAASATREWTEQETLLLLEVTEERKREFCENRSGQGTTITCQWGEFMECCHEQDVMLS